MSGMAGRKSGPRLGRLATLASMLMAPLPAIAADPAAPRSGFYVGGHVGYLFGGANATLGDPTNSASGGIASAGGTERLRHLLRRRAGGLRALTSPRG